MIKIKAPATTANMGPGFDCFGMALNIYNEISIEETKGETQVMYKGKPFFIPLSENLIYNSLIYTLKKYDYSFKGFKINIDRCDIPVSRGLGSSAACIALGMKAANEFMGNIMSKDDMLKIACEIEGHPDNVTPAILGGMTCATSTENGRVIYSKVNIPEILKFAVMVPNFKVSTNEARKVLPDTYSRKDCVFNLSRAALLVSYLNNGNVDELRNCFQDKIHQPYRKKIIKNVDEIFDFCKNNGSLGEFISGSGSTLIAVIKDNYDEFLQNIVKCFLDIKGDWKINIAEPDYEGVKIIR